MRPRRSSCTSLVLCVATLTACAAPSASRGSTAPSPAAPRVYDSSARRFVAFDALVAAAARADVVFVGEQHGDPETHFAEFALLDGVGRRRERVILSLEMFERDVQGVVDDYLAGRIDEQSFLSRARPWERYATDYRPMVQLARARGWPVVASNVPRALANAVSRRGLAALDTLSQRDRALTARELDCPRDRYFSRFADQMKGHSAGGVASDTSGLGALTVRFYEAQCLKDETMAESIASTRAFHGTAPLVVHYDGAFHSDFGLGTVARARRRLPNARTLVVTAVPVRDPSAVPADSIVARADFIVLTRAPAPGR